MQQDIVISNPPLKGKLHIRIVEHRNLVINQHSRPYCVVQFDKCDWVTREPTLSIWNQEATFDVISHSNELAISLWDRADESFIGIMKIRPPSDSGKLYDNFFLLSPTKAELRIQLLYRAISQKPLSSADFELLNLVGKGSFGKVWQVRKKDTKRIYAMKVLVKKDILAKREVAHTISERNVLAQATCPFLVGLKFSFQTRDKLYLVLDYMNGGELFFHLQKEKHFSIGRTRFYTCELIAALGHLHSFNIIYRDLKPENILLDSTGHIALTDFGLCKEGVKEGDVTNTFCGTAEYLAPEVLRGGGYGKSVDWWSLGILFYEMLFGLPPFYDENTNLMCIIFLTLDEKILNAPLLFPASFPEPAKSLCISLLQRDPTNRIGSGPEDAEEIKRHLFFKDIDWQRLLKKGIKPPYKPHVDSDIDTSNFDPVFTSELVVDSLPNASAPLSDTLQLNFQGFTFNGDDQI